MTSTPEILEFDAWCERCARRLSEIDDQLTIAEARCLARDVHAFERTRAMEPSQAAEFVAAEMARSDRSPFERRSVAR